MKLKNNVFCFGFDSSIKIYTPLDFLYHLECIEKKKILTDNYDDFDMSKLIVKTPIDHKYYYSIKCTT